MSNVANYPLLVFVISFFALWLSGAYRILRARAQAKPRRRVA